MVMNMLQKVIDAIFTFFLKIFLSGFFPRSKREKSADSKGVYLPDYMLLIGIIAAILFAIVACITAFNCDNIIYSVMFGVFSLLGIIMIIAWKNCSVIYNDTGFTQKTFFGIKRHFTYDQVTAYSGKLNCSDIRIYTGGKRVFIDKIAVGRDEFFSLLKKKYRTMHDGKAIPVKKNNRFDIFNGHVERPGEFICVYLLFIIFEISMIILVFCNTWMPVSEQNTEQYTQVFSHCEKNGNDLLLFPANGSDYYVIGDCDKYMDNAESFISLGDGDNEFVVWAKYCEPKQDSSYYEVCNISLGEDTYYSFADATDRNRMNSMWCILLFGAIFLMSCAAIVASVVIGRNPKKFSSKVVRFFFKDGCIHY